MTQNDIFDIDRVAFIGRTFEEYMKLFDLNEDLLGAGPVLDCPAGASSFTAEAGRRGVQATACDILFDRPLDLLVGKGRKDVEYIYDKVEERSHLFTWDYYRDRDGLVSYRNRALELFAEDYARGLDEGRYVHAELPSLPFADNTFALVLSSHFLFLYGDRLGLDFHIASIEEMLRVCHGELRMYPLTELDIRPYQYLDMVIDRIRTKGYTIEIVPVPFEFQKGSDRMMRIMCNKNRREK